MSLSAPYIERSLVLNFYGDWGLANFHRICSWLCQEFCDRAGSRSQVAIRSWRDGGVEAMQAVQDGSAQLCIATPAMLLPLALAGEGMFEGRAMPDLRALATIPQNDRLVLAINPSFGIDNFEALRTKKPALRIAASVNDGSNFIGHVSQCLMDAHGISNAELESWGGGYVTRTRPDEALALMQSGEVDAVIQEAIMTPWWSGVINEGKAVPLPAEAEALEKLESEFGFASNTLPAYYWESFGQELPALDFSDFVVLVRSDLPEDVAYLLSWCLVETREKFERQYRHIPLRQSPVSYPLVPSQMAITPIPLHDGAKRYYLDAGHIAA